MTNYNRPPGDRDEEVRYERERAAENGGTANGLAIGGTLAALLGLGAAALYYWSRPTPTPSSTTIINPPASSVPAASTAPQSPQPTRIIERTVEKAAPPPKVIQVTKPVIVPGATKTIEVQKPVLVPDPTKTTAVQQPATPSSSAPSVAPSPSATPAPTASQSPAPSDSPSSTSPSNGTNDSN